MIISPSDPRDIATLLNMGRDPNQVDAEIQMDVFSGVLQRQRTMFYNRGFGVAPMENYPSGAQFVIGTRHSIASWVARRNKEVGDGSGSTIDRRAITSQALITVVSRDSGNAQLGAVDVQILVIPMHDLKKRVPVTVPMGGQ